MRKPLLVRISADLTKPSLPGYSLVTTPVTHFILGVLSSRTRTTEPTTSLPREENFLTDGGRFRRYSVDQTDQNRFSRLSQTLALSGSILGETASGSSKTLA